ncbi:glyoxalase [Microbacterium paludicola]|uniref:Glyoxalase n=1 Tax=Microbacterium paludicola TaxID=300019 RepID=A0A4Y9FYB9_9MICO|nr:glyoxalase superfamily protein [Microbacterium paludicola]MBF0815558.1 VOC family protein [Microbacterium paludicola]TFU33861.1 glyoxalase [Microbacterium paludicola]
MDFRIELIFVPVSDTDRAVTFYGDTLGWNVDHDHRVDDSLRFVQVTPPGSACSISFGDGITDDAPGSMRNVQVVVEDADEALAYLRDRGVEAEGVDDQPWGRFVRFADPDGNAWVLQQLVRPGG